jgi:hypothetical protein
MSLPKGVQMKPEWKPFERNDSWTLLEQVKVRAQRQLSVNFHSSFDLLLNTFQYIHMFHVYIRFAF